MDERERDEEPVLLAAGERHEPGISLGVETEPGQKRVGVDDAGVERPPEVDSLPDLDALLEVRFLVLHSDSLAERIAVAPWIEAEHRDLSLVGDAVALHTLHRGGLSRAVRTYQPEDLALQHFEGDVVHRYGTAVALAEAGDGNDGI